jgi:hypothetical protein
MLLPAFAFAAEEAQPASAPDANTAAEAAAQQPADEAPASDAPRALPAETQQQPDSAAAVQPEAAAPQAPAAPAAPAQSSGPAQVSPAPRQGPAASPAQPQAYEPPPRFAVGALIGPNTPAGIGVEMVFRTGNHFGLALDGGLCSSGIHGIGSCGLRAGIEGRVYFLPIVSSPYFSFDLHGNTGMIAEDPKAQHDKKGKETDETFTYTTEYSEMVGVGFGYHLVLGHFFVEPQVGYAVMVAGGDWETDPAPETLSTYDRDIAMGDRGGLRLGLAAGATF